MSGPPKNGALLALAYETSDLFGNGALLVKIPNLGYNGFPKSCWSEITGQTFSGQPIPQKLCSPPYWMTLWRSAAEGSFAF